MTDADEKKYDESPTVRVLRVIPVQQRKKVRNGCYGIICVAAICVAVLLILQLGDRSGPDGHCTVPRELRQMRTRLLHVMRRRHGLDLLPYRALPPPQDAGAARQAAGRAEDHGVTTTVLPATAVHRSLLREDDPEAARRTAARPGSRPVAVLPPPPPPQARAGPGRAGARGCRGGTTA